MLIIPSALAIGGSSASFYMPSYEHSLVTENTSSASYTLKVHEVAYTEHYGASASYCGIVGFFGNICSLNVTVQYINYTYPTNGTSLPYSIGIGIKIQDDLSAWTNCNYSVLWSGDNSFSGDASFPRHEYDTVVATCGNESEYDLNLDFNGEYIFEFCGTNATGGVQCGNDTFYVDRSENQSSKTWGGMLWPAALLGVAVLLQGVGYKRRKDTTSISWLYSFAALLLIPMSVMLATLVLQEYVKLPTLVDSYKTLFVVLFWGLIITSGAYALIRIIIYLVGKFATKKEGKIEI